MYAIETQNTNKDDKGLAMHKSNPLMTLDTVNTNTNRCMQANTNKDDKGLAMYTRIPLMTFYTVKANLNRCMQLKYTTQTKMTKGWQCTKGTH